MPRPKKCRMVDADPGVRLFKPQMAGPIWRQPARLQIQKGPHDTVKENHAEAKGRCEK